MAAANISINVKDKEYTNYSWLTNAAKIDGSDKDSQNTVFNSADINKMNDEQLEAFVNGIISEFMVDAKHLTLIPAKRDKLIGIINEADAKKREKIIELLNAKGAQVFVKEIEAKTKPTTKNEDIILTIKHYNIQITNQPYAKLKNSAAVYKGDKNKEAGILNFRDINIMSDQQLEDFAKETVTTLNSSDAGPVYALKKYSGTTEELNADYVKWEQKYTNDDNFVLRSETPPHNPISKTKSADIQKLWIDKTYNPKHKGEKFIKCVAELNGEKYIAYIRDNGPEARDRTGKRVVDPDIGLNNTRREDLVNLLNDPQLLSGKRKKLLEILKNSNASAFIAEVEAKQILFSKDVVRVTAQKSIPVVNIDFPDYTISGISTRNRKVERADLEKLFAGNKEINYSELEDFLTSKAGWSREAVAILFGDKKPANENDKVAISKEHFVDMINKHASRFNENSLKPEFCDARGLKDVGKTFGEYTTFLKYSKQNARDAIKKLDAKKNKTSDLANMLRRYKTLNGKPKDWDDFEIEALYVRLTLDKDKNLSSNKDDLDLEHIVDKGEIIFDKFCQAYGITDTEPAVELPLRKYAGTEEELSKKYVRWNGPQTNDTFFSLRDDHTKEIIKPQRYADVYKLWIPASYNPRNNKGKGELIDVVCEIEGQKYHAKIWDQPIHDPDNKKRIRYVDGHPDKQEQFDSVAKK